MEKEKKGREGKYKRKRERVERRERIEGPIDRVTKRRRERKNSFAEGVSNGRRYANIETRFDSGKENRSQMGIFVFVGLFCAVDNAKKTMQYWISRISYGWID